MKEREREMLGESVDLNNDNAVEDKHDDISVDFEEELKDFNKKDVIDGDKKYHPFLVLPKANSIGEIIRSVNHVQKMPDTKFLKALKYQKKEIGLMFNKLRDFLGYPSVLNAKLIKDSLKDRENWTYFYSYLSLLEKWRRDLRSLIRNTMKQVGESLSAGKSTQMKKNLDPTLEAMNTGGTVSRTVKYFSGLFWRLIMMKALGDTNEAFTEYERSFLQKLCGCGKYNKKNLKAKKLKTIWDRKNYNPMSPYLEYDTSERMMNKWRYYEINEVGHRDIFRTMDRLKIIDMILPEMFDIYSVAKPGSLFMEGFTPLHNPYELDKAQKLPLFDDIPEIVTSVDSPDYLESFFMFMRALSDEAEGRDFITESLKDKLSYGCFGQMKIDEGEIQNYFGEKIGLYFLYLKYFTKSLKWMAFIGLLVFILEIVLLTLHNKSENAETELTLSLRAYHYMRYFFALLITIWLTMYMEYWKREEKLYAIKYGQLNFESKQKDRPGYKGQYKRDLGSSSMNEVYFSSFKRSVRLGLGILLSLFLILLSVSCTLGLLFFREVLKKKYGDTSRIASILPPILNSLVGMIFKIIYEIISKKLNFYENHQNVTTFEDSLIFKKASFNFVNTYHPYFILAFIKPYIDTFGHCVIPKDSTTLVRDVNSNPNPCYNELVTYVRTYFLVGFSLNFLEIIIPILKDKFTLKKLKIKRNYPWGIIDRKIEQEWIEKDPYQTTMEIDGVLNEYMEILLMIGFLGLFGQVFPLGFFLAFITYVCEIYIDKYKFLNIIRRPVPKGASDIGTWAFLTELGSFLGIFINVGLLTFTSASADFFAEDVLSKFVKFDKSDEASNLLFRFQHFVVLSLLLVLVRKAIEMLIPDIPQDLQELLVRQQLILENMRFKKKQVSTKARSGLLVGKWRDEEILGLVPNPDEIAHQTLRSKRSQKRNSKFSAMNTPSQKNKIPKLEKPKKAPGDIEEEVKPENL